MRSAAGVTSICSGLASSGSVYGVKEEPEVTEDLPLVPISDYNKTKMEEKRSVQERKREVEKLKQQYALTEEDIKK